MSVHAADILSFTQAFFWFAYFNFRSDTYMSTTNTPYRNLSFSLSWSKEITHRLSMEKPHFHCRPGNKFVSLLFKCHFNNFQPNLKLASGMTVV